LIAAKVAIVMVFIKVEVLPASVLSLLTAGSCHVCHSSLLFLIKGEIYRIGCLPKRPCITSTAPRIVDTTPGIAGSFVGGVRVNVPAVDSFTESVVAPRRHADPAGNTIEPDVSSFFLSCHHGRTGGRTVVAVALRKVSAGRWIGGGSCGNSTIAHLLP